MHVMDKPPIWSHGQTTNMSNMEYALSSLNASLVRTYASTLLMSVHCTMYIAQRTLYSVRTVYIELPYASTLLMSVHCTMYIAQRTLYSVRTVYIELPYV